MGRPDLSLSARREQPFTVRGQAWMGLYMIAQPYAYFKK